MTSMISVKLPTLSGILESHLLAVNRDAPHPRSPNHPVPLAVPDKPVLNEEGLTGRAPQKGTNRTRGGAGTPHSGLRYSPAVAESLGNGEHTDLQVGKHRVHTCCRWRPPRSPGESSPQRSCCKGECWEQGKGLGTGTAVRRCLLFLLPLLLPSPLQGHPLSHPRLLPPGMAPSTRPPGHFSEASCCHHPSLLLLAERGSSFPLKFFIFHFFPLCTNLRLLNNLPTVLSHSPARAVWRLLPQSHHTTCVLVDL